MSYTISASVTDTYTEARARHVMGKVYDHLVSLYMKGVITKERADRFRSDILYLMDRRAVTYFQLQFKRPNGSEIGGLHYEVRSDATIIMDQDSGGIDFWGLPSNASVSLVVQLNRSSPYIAQVDQQLTDWGWGRASSLTGTHGASKSFSKDGYGLTQSIVGKW